MRLLLPFMRVEPVATTLQQIGENFEVLRLMECSGSFRVEMDGNREALLRFALDCGASLWTKECHQALADSLKEENQARCQKCRRIATSFLDCSCGNYAWCQKHEDTTLLWDHADHDCFPACCAHGHPYPIVTVKETESILYAQMPPPDEICFLEDPASEQDRAIFHVKVRQKSQEERTYEAEDIRKRFDVKDEALGIPAKQWRDKNEESYVQLFLTPPARGT